MTVLRGVDVGEGSVVAATSGVTKDVPAYSVAAGVPARVIKSRRPEEPAPDDDRAPDGKAPDEETG